MKLTRRQAIAAIGALPLVDAVVVHEITDKDLLVITIDRDLNDHECADAPTVRNATILMLKGQCEKLGIDRYLIVPRGVRTHVMQEKEDLA